MFEIVLSSTTILLNIYLGLFVFLRNPLSWTNRFFLALTIFINGYVITNYLSLHPPVPGPENQLLWIRIVMSEASFLGPTLLFLVMTFPRDKLQISKSKLIAICTLMITSAALSLSPFVFTRIEYPNGSPVPIPGPAIPIFFIDFAGLFLLSFIILIVKYRRAVGLEKVQLKYFLAGIILTFSLLTLTTLFSVVLFKNSQLVFLGPAFTMILVGFITYAIVKHRFLDIRLIVARSVAYTLLVVLIGTFYGAAAFLLSEVLLGFTIPRLQLLINTLLAVLIALTFERLRIFIERFTDQFLFKGQYEPDELLSKLSHLMSTEIELHLLSHNILENLIDQMRLTRGAFVLLKNDSIYDFIEIGYEKYPQPLYNQLELLRPQDQTMVFDELEESPLKTILRQLNVSVAHTLKVKSEVIGILLLGEKASGEIYSSKDLRVIEIFAPEVAVAIQNALSYEQIKQFNITLKQEVERATGDLTKANEKLKELDKLKNDFVSVASHELRTPMTAIRSYAWMALNRSDVQLSDKIKKYLVRVLISSERLINLVSDMLNISRIESGKVEIKPEAFDLNNLFKDLVSEISIKASEKQIKVLLKESKVPKVIADPEKVYQIALNILGNSLKFTPENGTVQISFFTDGKVVETAITDTGVGIVPEDLSKLFQKFGRLDSSYVAAATSGGTGLGLYISKSLIELMKGKIWARSEGLGKGTTFIFSLPVATSQNLANQQSFAVKPLGEAKKLEPVTI